MHSFVPGSEEIYSAGIDIGTSTTKLVLSKFFIRNMAGGMHMPRIEIVNKEMIHRSPIYRTPLQSATAIDMEKVKDLVMLEYEKAGISPADIKTGAVMITGETATKHNAREVVDHLSDYAGDFLVATAGPDLEGIIAAKGSGAYEYSKKTGKVIANIDIGGGTANVAVYQAGKLCGTCTLHIGGRLIELAGGHIQRLSPPIKQLLPQLGVTLVEGRGYTRLELKQITDYMAAVIARTLRRRLSGEDHVLLLGHLPNWEEEIEAIMFSGGVSECLYRYERAAEETGYEDIGELLAVSLKENNNLASWRWIPPSETVRATVLGAGTQTTDISGATIQVDPADLPIKNLPVFRVSLNHDLKAVKAVIHQAVKQAIELYDPQREGQNFALYVSDIPYLSFKDVQFLAMVLLEAIQAKPFSAQPLVIVLEADYAKVLGQTLTFQARQQSVISIDQIYVGHGDYIDIGHLLKTGVVPVVVKTLTFQH
ncbi:ethanolamine ammonia-lyase reactivating factor EutA [Halalkalibacter oceani]|uniref:Ethanolamine ammonia-lyase reactivating factor EutA n=1 Tax=Halalkalibacter oceani TaxID=1653776 RepID=A0A9X2IP83_9BACI|nr:ethanolamine ammonia-lyase reactivating factor EutA [Halalkalibacter oceani]